VWGSSLLKKPTPACRATDSAQRHVAIPNYSGMEDPAKRTASSTYQALSTGREERVVKNYRLPAQDENPAVYSTENASSTLPGKPFLTPM
jgi:hypothetical protein